MQISEFEPIASDGDGLVLRRAEFFRIIERRSAVDTSRGRADRMVEKRVNKEDDLKTGYPFRA
jgi:hypothetical protein